MTASFTIGKYEVQGRIGEGGVAIVYQGYDPVIQRTVALKALSRSLLGPAERDFILQRFRREAQSAGRLVHPNIVAVFEYGEDEEFAFIAMEFVIGETLERHLQHNPRPDPIWIREFAAQLLDALEYSHSHGVVHRDIKPANIMVMKEGRIKVSDFGIARIETSATTQGSEWVGTPNYMAPEQFQGQPADHRSDIYAAGVIIYELLAGRRPFQGDTAEVMRQAVQVMPRPPSEINPEVPSAADDVVLKALAKRPAERWQSAHEFAVAFEQALEQRPSLDLDLSSGQRSGVQSQPPSGLMTLARRLGVVRTPGPTDIRPPAGGEETASKPRILFVDDEERILTALKSLFRSGYHVFTATSGSQAMEFVRRFPIHVVVSDQRMPGMTGVELLREVKEISPGTVRMLLTGYSDLAAIVGSINEGEVYRFVSKPWNNQEITTILAEAAAIGVALAETRSTQGLVSRTEATVLVLDDAQELYRAARELLADICPVAYARTLDEALHVMQEVEVAVLVADLDMPGVDMASFLKLLKSEHPEILSIVITQASDSESIIELINQAQIFRFLNKPVNLALMKGHALVALSRYQAFKTDPQLLQQQHVQDSPKARSGGLAGTVLDGLKALRSRVGLHQEQP
ncbi:MAG TPA: response regulator [Burkholderiales bacterium]